MEVPQGSSGVVLQGTGYWSFDGEMTGADQGFKLNDTIPEVIWFTNHVQNIYLYGLVRYQFISPIGY